MKPQICVVGSVNMDLVFRTPRMPAVGETLHGHEFRQIPGGKGANQAVAAARQGADVRFIGAVGDDGFGDFSQQSLSSDGITLTHLSRIPGVATGVAGILVEDNGSNSIVLAAGANASLTPAHIDAAASDIRNAQILLCQLETPLDTVTHAIATAHAAGVKVILNPAPAQDLSPALLAQVDYLILNETEAAQLSGVLVTDTVSAQAASEKLLAMGVGQVLLTMGGHGAQITQAGQSQFIPAIRVDVVDTTAAGDTFVGAFAVGIANGLSLLEASQEAQYTAALTVTKLGAQTSIPKRAEVVAFMAARTA
ncbi:ribokinase [Undibacterium rugosum]|uniref:Ribokinase n=1 Tax=Undibacterium rugosum TaxID=2762291 RepID=A0A923I0E9_9BURK|nr:ribokinase [Undibacterium rugosum]MBC3934712.1 ribokinase [Undibacterium rugosum]MBR7778439.1 ribokinase [Undibacterium rugosum]